MTLLASSSSCSCRRTIFRRRSIASSGFSSLCGVFSVEEPKTRLYALRKLRLRFVVVEDGGDVRESRRCIRVPVGLGTALWEDLGGMSFGRELFGEACD